MTLKSIIEIASGDYYMIRMQRINDIQRCMDSKTEYEKAEAEKEIKRLAKEIKDGLAI